MSGFWFQGNVEATWSRQDSGKYLSDVPKAKAPNYHSDSSVPSLAAAPDDFTGAPAAGWWVSG